MSKMPKFCVFKRQLDSKLVGDETRNVRDFAACHSSSARRGACCAGTRSFQHDLLILALCAAAAGGAQGARRKAVAERVRSSQAPRRGQMQQQQTRGGSVKLASWSVGSVWSPWWPRHAARDATQRYLCLPAHTAEHVCMEPLMRS